MYYYIYDQFLNHKRYDKILAQIESKITDLEIKDRILKMSILKSVPELVTDALRKGAKTIVVVGNDQTINQIVNLIAGKNIVLGVIPINNQSAGADQNSIAHYLGVTEPLEACEVVSARKIETLNLGEINHNYFINSVKVFDRHLVVECDNKFTITSLTGEGIIGIYNFAPDLNFDSFKTNKFFNPQDNFLEVVVENQDKKVIKFFKSAPKNKTPDSVFRVKKILISSQEKKGGAVVVDNFKVFKTPLEIKISDKKLSVIVGRERKF